MMSSSTIQRWDFDDVLLYNTEVRVCWCPPLQLLQGFRGETLTMSSTTSSRIQRSELDDVLLYNSEVTVWRCPLQLLQGLEVRVWWNPPLQLLQGFRGESLVMSSSTVQRSEFNDVLLYNFFKDSEVRVWSVEPLNGDLAQLVQCQIWHAADSLLHAGRVFSHGPLSVQALLKTWCPCRPSVQSHGQMSVCTLKIEALAAVHCTIASRRFPLPNSRPAVFSALYCCPPP